MNFELTPEQKQLADSVSKYLSNEYSFEKRKAILNSVSGVSEASWKTFADMGLTAMTLSEADSGFGGGAMDLMAVMEAMGEALVVEPFLENVALAGRLVSRMGSDAQRAALLPGLIDGTERLAFAYLEQGLRYQLSPQLTLAKANAGAWVLNGRKCLVTGAASAGHLLVSALTPQGASLFIVDIKASGVELNPSRTVDGFRVADITFSNVVLNADALLGEDGAAMPFIEEAADFATALLCAEAIGAMKSANDATLDYIKQRKQFGVPIASFQVLQHRMVEMYITTEQARSMAILAASKVDDTTNATSRARAVSAAKIKIADAARLVSQESVQLHGGMGMTEELKVSHTFRRLTMIAQQFGDVDHHLERYADLT
ncbi:MAG: pimeloyl-CoA dehydrogenase small subunit [Betaproteobacteria bacterium]|nr:pimeloyl-CoA dehydrogenase small subunit [Betaproteobacteria bacterium]